MEVNHGKRLVASRSGRPPARRKYRGIVSLTLSINKLAPVIISAAPAAAERDALLIVIPMSAAAKAGSGGGEKSIAVSNGTPPGEGLLR